MKVQRPMDFSTIEANITKHHYKLVEDFRKDIEQVKIYFNNKNLCLDAYK